MSLQLDARQRAMLAEMGLRLFDRPVDSGPAEPAAAASVAPAARPVATRVVPVATESIAVQAHPSRTDGTFDSKTPVKTVFGERPAGIEQMDWEALAQAVAGCRACGLCEGRRNTVFGVGDTQADWLIVGEAPGENEDLQGEPFVGQAGKLLDNMLKAIGLDRGHKVYIANVLK
ncbi:MAG: uracil-DNA glycosylase, partial [Ramlibacter sp.]